MKKVERVLVIVTIAFFGGFIHGQIGVKGGFGVSSLLVKNNDVNFSQELFNAGFSFHIGSSFEIDFSDVVSLEPGLLLTQRAYSIDAIQLVSNTLTSIEVPINVKVYALDLGDVGRLYGLGGTYLGYIFSAREDGQKLDVGNKLADDIKPLDIGVNFGAGVQFFDALNVDLSASIGMANLSNVRTNAARVATRVVRLTVTYQFGRQVFF